MNKIIFTIISFLLSISLSAQELQFQTSEKQFKIVSEYMQSKEKHTWYSYAEICSSADISTYMQTFYEHSLGTVSIHAEYRGFLYAGDKWQNSFIAGISFNILACDNAYINLAPLYRYESKNMWQATATYGANYKNITFDGYFDLYGDDKINGFSENKVKIHFDKYFIGTNIEYFLLERYSKVTPYIMFGISL